MIEIKTNKTQQGPSEGWLDFVKTNTAKIQIKKYVAKKNEKLLKDDMILKGKLSLIDAFKERDVDEKEMINYLNNPKLFEYFEVADLDDLYYRVYQRKPTTNAIIDFLKLKKKETIFLSKRQANFGLFPVYCRGADNIAITLANCCTPIPGDPIVGYITKGKGITVHRTDCPNIAQEKERLIDVFWKEGIPDASYPVDIAVEASDRANLLVDIMHTLTNNHINIQKISARKNVSNLTATIDATILVQNRDKLNSIFAIIHGIPGVYIVKRMTH